MGGAYKFSDRFFSSDRFFLWGAAAPQTSRYTTAIHSHVNLRTVIIHCAIDIGRVHRHNNTIHTASHSGDARCH